MASLHCQNFIKNLQLELSSEKFVICEYSHFTTLLESRFSTRKSGLGNFAVVYYYVITLLRQNFSESPELGLSCNLRNFTFYNFSENLDFQSYEEGWATLQLPFISRSLITMSKLHKKLPVRAIF